MNNLGFPTNVYSLSLNKFSAIPGSPWVYKISADVRDLFSKFPSLSSVATPRQGLTTADNTRFIRFWWECGANGLGLNCTNCDEALSSEKRWFPLVKRSHKGKWYGGETEICNWEHDGKEIKAYIVERYPYLKGNWEWVAKNPNYYFHEGAAYSAVTSGGLSFRWMPNGFICEHASNAIYSDSDDWSHLTLVGLFNSSFANYIVGLNETINVNIDDLLRMPVFESTDSKLLENLVVECILIRQKEDTQTEILKSFVIPHNLQTGMNDLAHTKRRLLENEKKVNDEVFRLYGVSDKDQIDIEYELTHKEVNGDVIAETDQITDDEDSTDEIQVNNLKVPWLSYAIGIILGRFQPGTTGSLGSAINYRTDFAIGSLPEPTEEEFNELVGDPSQFAYVNEQGGRHVFTRPVEQALQKLALPDGIAVFDPNHPRDLPTLVSKALELMLGQDQAQEVIQQAAGGDLRKFLEKDFFTQHHIKQYRKRPVYWPIQSSKRSYGFVLFHEKIDRNTFYALQQEPYLPTKRRAVQLRLEELGKKVLTAQGAARKPIEKEMDELRQLAEELAQFAKDLDAITRGGYEPEADWIDDGVILRMAPLWSVIPLWKSEPKKYWEELAAGKYDWSRIAMKYWPERVKQVCKKNKSYAIAHGHEEWFIGN
jgi:hypothetical protein